MTARGHWGLSQKSRKKFAAFEKKNHLINALTIAYLSPWHHIYRQQKNTWKWFAQIRFYIRKMFFFFLIGVKKDVFSFIDFQNSSIRKTATINILNKFSREYLVVIFKRERKTLQTRKTLLSTRKTHIHIYTVTYAKKNSYKMFFVLSIIKTAAFAKRRFLFYPLSKQ